MPKGYAFLFRPNNAGLRKWRKREDSLRLPLCGIAHCHSLALTPGRANATLLPLLSRPFESIFKFKSYQAIALNRQRSAVYTRGKDKKISVKAILFAVSENEPTAQFFCGAGGGGRTHTSFRTWDFKFSRHKII